MEQLLNELHLLRQRVEHHCETTHDRHALMLKAELLEMELAYQRMLLRKGNGDRAVAGEIDTH